MTITDLCSLCNSANSSFLFHSFVFPVYKHRNAYGRTDRKRFGLCLLQNILKFTYNETNGGRMQNQTSFAETGGEEDD